MAYLIEPRWINIPEEEIYQKLLKAGVTTWGAKAIGTRYYLFGERYAYPYSLPPETIDRLSKRLNEATYMTWYRHYNEQAIAYFDEHNLALNQAIEYWEQVGDQALPKPEILPTDGIEPGREYIAIIGLFHITGEENRGNSHLFIDLIDGQGNRIYTHTPPLYLYYGWEGMTTEQERTTAPVRIDKPLNEPGGNIGITWPQVIYGFHINNFGCDRFRGIHIRYPDDGPGNNQGHHSHYIVLQKRIFQGETPPDPEPPDPEPEPTGYVMAIKKEWLEKQPVRDGYYIIEEG